MNKQSSNKTIRIVLFCLIFSGCATPGMFLPEVSATNVVKTSIMTATPQAIYTTTPSSLPFYLPTLTMSPQESENALLELLGTNGNCTGKCIAGIKPDEMNVQEAVNAMSQWGMVRVGEDYFGHTYINIQPGHLYGKVGVYLSLGTWTEEFKSIDTLTFRIQNIEGGRVETDLWEENRNNWKGFRLDNLLRAYGIPSYVGYDFYRLFAEGLHEGRTMGYLMEIQYQASQLVIYSQAMAYFDGKNIFVCPIKDPQYFEMAIYPERPLNKRQEFAPVTWQSLTETDLQTFYQIFTDETNPDACVTTNLKQIQSLKPSFH